MVQKGAGTVGAGARRLAPGDVTRSRWRRLCGHLYSCWSVWLSRVCEHGLADLLPRLSGSSWTMAAIFIQNQLLRGFGDSWVLLVSPVKQSGCAGRCGNSTSTLPAVQQFLQQREPAVLLWPSAAGFIHSRIKTSSDFCRCLLIEYYSHEVQLSFSKNLHFGLFILTQRVKQATGEICLKKQ